MSNVAVIICAAGAGSRFGTKRKKQFTDVAGRAVFLRSVEIFADRDDVKQILLAIPQEDEELVKVKWGANLQFYNTKLYFGGEQRFETVQKGLELLKDEIDLVAVHDSVRCCPKKQWLDDCFKKADETGAAILAGPVVATIKKVKEGVIEKTVDRTDLYEAQTPQVFKKELLIKAYANLDKVDRDTISDDAQLVESLGEKVAVVETDYSNIKITTAADIAIAEAIIKLRSAESRKKTGYVGPYGEPQW